MRLNLYMNRIEAMVFATGAAVLVVEISAVRILSMYFGGTTYTVSGVITVILAALAAGYMRGGAKADAAPTRQGFYRIIECAGALLLVSSLLAFPATRELSPSLTGSWGPLLLAALLFAGPTYLLGMLSPYAVRLVNDDKHPGRLGAASGRVFFFSTIGSLFGSLAVTFVLIPNLDMRLIMLVTSLCVFGIGMFGASAEGRRRGTDMTKLTAAVLVSLLGMTMPSNLQPAPGFETVYSAEGDYGRIEVVEGMQGGRIVRYLRQDRNWSGGVYADGEGFVHPVFSYIGLYRLFSPDPRRALFLGGGAYVMPAELLRLEPDVQIDVVEVEPSLYPLAQRFFNLPESDRITNHVSDCRRFVEQSAQSYDIIVSDVYSVYAPPPGCSTQEFFEAVSAHLSADGMFMANLLGGLSPEDSGRTIGLVRTIHDVFPNVYVFATDSATSLRAQNIVVLAYTGQGPSAGAFADVSRSLHLDLAEHLVDLSGLPLERFPVLTDTYAPVEYLPGRPAGI